jgi:hypothetical protein
MQYQGKIPFHHRMAQGKRFEKSLTIAHKKCLLIVFGIFLVKLEGLQKCIQNERGLPAISDRFV